MRSKLLIWTILTGIAAIGPCNAQSRSANRSVPAVTRDFGQLPLTFEVNRGQSDAQVRFLSRGKGYTAFLTGGGLTLSLLPTSVGEVGAGQPRTPSTVQVNLVGATHNPVAVGEELQPGRVNYFLGNDPKKWHVNIPTYGSVRYRAVYPGIDLVYYGNHRQLEYDFEVQPGADPRRIQFEVRGATQILLDSEGSLLVKLASGELRLVCPSVYQQIAGHRIAVKGQYVLTDATHVSFDVEHYDASKPLVIDPVLVYATYLGGSGNDLATGIAVDAAGSVYLAGYSDSIDFPLTTASNLSKTANHVFVAKLDPAGANLVYADFIGGNSEDYGLALALDQANNVYVTGSTTSSNFPAVNAYQSQQPGPYAGFLTRVSADGSALVYSTYLGGSTFDQPAGVAIDNLGQAYVAGSTMSQNFPVVNAYQSSALANQGNVYGFYGFLTKFSKDGSTLIYSTYLAGNSVVPQTCGNAPCWPAPYNQISAVAVDTSGNAFVTGSTNTNNFPVTSGAFQTTNPTQQDTALGFVSKFGPGGALGYSTYFYGASGNSMEVNAIAVDGSGAAYITGYAASDGTFPITSTSICDPSVYGYGCSYAFVTKLDPMGSTLLYSTFLGPNNYAAPRAIQVDLQGDAYVLASTTSAAFQTSNPIEQYTNNSDLLVVEIDPGATTQLFSTFLGGGGNDAPAGLALDASNNIYVTGYTDSTDFPVTQGVFQGRPGGTTDAFIAKIGAASVAAVSLAPNSLQFPAEPLGSTSQVQQVLLRNVSSVSLGITSIAASGDFAESDDCGSGLTAAGNCTVSITFTPTMAGVRTGALVVNDAASGSPHTVNLTGSGLGPVATLTPANLTFPGMLIGSPSSAQSVQLSNSGTAVLSISSVQATGDYAQANNCPASLAIGASCTINVTFTPSASGNRTGSLTIGDNASGSPQNVGLSGSGIDFVLSSSPMSDTVKAGASASYTLKVASVGGAFNNPVTLSCSGAPANATCSLATSSVTPGANSATVVLTVSTTGNSAQVTQPKSSDSQPIYAFWLQLPGFGVFGVLLLGSKQRRKKVLPLFFALMIGALLLTTACAGGTGIGQQNQTGTKPGTYTITVAGSSGAIQHSLPVTLIVQ